METVKAMLIFSRVLEMGSMSAVARELGITSSAVSQHVRTLERHYNVQLLHRTTRKISPTSAGQVLWQGAKQISQTLVQTQLALAELQTEFIGKVVISLPTGFIDSVAIKQFIAGVKWQYPHIQLELVPDDHIADLMNEQLDIAIRAAEPDSNSLLITRYLTQWRLCICASPAYLMKNPIRTISDLASQRWIKYNETVFYNTFSSLGLGNIQLDNPFICSSITAAKSLAISGFGLTFQLFGEVEKFVEKGELEIILPEAEMPFYNLYAVTAHRTQSAKIEAILRLLKECFRGEAANG